MNVEWNRMYDRANAYAQNHQHKLNGGPQGDWTCTASAPRREFKAVPYAEQVTDTFQTRCSKDLEFSDMVKAPAHGLRDLLHLNRKHQDTLVPSAFGRNLEISSDSRIRARSATFQDQERWLPLPGQDPNFSGPVL